MSEEGRSRAWSAEALQLLFSDMGVQAAGPAERDGAATDFGGLTRGVVAAVATPRSIDELHRILSFAGARALPLTLRGRGLSQGGQAIAAGGVTVDLSRLDRIDAPDPRARTIRCESGATFRALLTATAPHGLAPSVVPLNLDLTVGGALSVGGLGATSHTYGPIIAEVAALEVITGSGRRVACSSEIEPEVFGAVLGGLGYMGAIASATLKLRPMKRAVRTFYCLFDAMEPWIEAQRALIAAGGVDYLEAFCSPCVQGFRNEAGGRRLFAEWLFVMHASFEHEGVAPSAQQVFGGLPSFRVVHVEDAESLAFADRYAPRFAAMRRSGSWHHVHPWVEAIVPLAATASILKRVLDQVPLGLGENPRLLFVAKRNLPRFFMVPEAAELAMVALTPAAVPPHLREETLAFMERAHALFASEGGRRYLSGWLAMMGAEAWRDHFGGQLDAWQASKNVLDPAGVLGSALRRG